MMKASLYANVVTMRDRMPAPAATPAAQVQLKMASELFGSRIGSSTMAAFVSDQSIIHTIPSKRIILVTGSRITLFKPTSSGSDLLRGTLSNLCLII